jgi:lipoprotein NlpI
VYGEKGEYDRAIADFDEVLRLNPNYAPAYRNRGMAQFKVAKFEAAALDLAKALELSPTDAYVALWLYLAQARAGQDGRVDLEKRVPRLRLQDWPGPVVSLYLGQSTPETTLAAAANPDPKRQQEQQCEADFYVGEHFLLRGAKADALRLLRSAAAICPATYYEASGAKAELQRLGN